MNLLALKTHNAVFQSKKRKVPAQTDIKTGFEFRSALADDNRPGLCYLTTIELYTPILRITIASVS